jgi:cell division protein FtsQ
MKKPNKNDSSKSINLNNEIIIGLTPKKEENNKKNKKEIKPKKKTVVKKQIKKNDKKDKKNNSIKINKPKLKSKRRKIIKWTSLLILLALCIILFLLSSVFNIKQIIVTNNSKITSEQIIALSGLNTNENIFKATDSKIKENLKSNPYIDDVKIKRKLNGAITLQITERVATYMLQYANTYVYISNQGYILELSQTPINVPIIEGFSTQQDQIKEGNRLEVEDLEKLDTVIKIMAAAKSKNIDAIITNINISNAQDYVLTISSELKTIHFGDLSNINEKMIWIQEIIDKNKGKNGEIYVNNPEKRVYFREKV